MSKSKSKISLENAQLIFAQRSQKLDYGIPFSKFVTEAYQGVPAKYGTAIAKKIATDFDGLLKTTKASENNGDVVNNAGLAFEIKSSFANAKKLFNLTHLRGHFQDFEFYIICLISTPDFTPRFYCVHKSILQNNSELKITAMNGNKISNAQNSNIDKRVTFHSDNVEKLFGQYNVLGGTQYSDLEFYILKRNGLKYRKDISHGKYFKPSKRREVRREAQQD